VGFLPDPLVVYEQGSHLRISNQIANSPISTVEKHMQVLLKHQRDLGSFWVKYHAARLLLYGVRLRGSRYRHLIYTIGRCGIVAVAAYFFGRIFRTWEVRK
jgi:hypothetical protein